MHHSWIPGNYCHLLENGEEYFPRVLEILSKAEKEILVETFILWEDKVGKSVRDALLAAAKRGVRIDVTVDDFGARTLSDGYLSTLIDAGIRVHIFDPLPKPFQRINYFRRLHRKLTVVDERHAFVGGINYSADHLLDYGPEAKQDYAVELQGPIVTEIRHFMLDAIQEGTIKRQVVRQILRQTLSLRCGDVDAMLVLRDNQNRRNDIEHHYRLAFRMARQRIVIANAYFFPGYRFLRAMRNAARRGVEVTLIVQGKPDMMIVKMAASLLYPQLLKEKIRIFEYCSRPMHAKVAIVDDEWATVGSSNLDPLSLSLNLEANVMIRDRKFNRQLNDSLQRMIQSCREVVPDRVPQSGVWHSLRSFLLFHFLRRFPSWADHIPAQSPVLKSPDPARPDEIEQLSETARDDSLQRMIQSCREVVPDRVPQSGVWHSLRSFLLFHFLRRFPSWADHIPAQSPVLKSPDSARPDEIEQLSETARDK